MNAQQLVALRALGAEQEADAAEKQAQLTASHDQEVARMQAQLDSGEERRLVTEVCTWPSWRPARAVTVRGECAALSCMTVEVA